MDEFDQKKKNSRSYWLIWLLALAVLAGGVFGTVYWLDNAGDTAKLGEPRDFASVADAKYSWDLTDMFSDLSQAREAYKSLEGKLETFKAYEGHLREAETFKKAIALYEDILVSEEKLRIYANLRKDTALDDGEVSDFLAAVEELDSRLSDGMAYFKPELSKLSDQQLTQYMGYKEAAHYTDLLDGIIYDRQSILSEREDRLLALLGEMDLSYENNYQAFWNRYDVVLRDIAYDNYYSNDEEKRFEATRASLQKQIDAVEVLASNLEGKVKYDNLVAKAYGFDSALDMVLSQDGISAKDYQAYEKVTDKQLTLYHRWIGLKQKMLKLERPYQYHDTQLSLLSKNLEVDYGEAVSSAREAFKPLGDDYLKVYEEAVGDRWVDVYPREGKYTGSYTWGAYASHPYVLLNYQDDFVSASTFSHEMGHAVHTYFSAKNQPFSTYENTIFKAEIASTANEVLFLEHQLKNQTGDARKEVLIQYIELITGTIFEQMKASEFEKQIHEAQAQGKDLDGNFLKETWQGLAAKYYGSSYKVTDLDGYDWTGLDHLYWNFYMYKYATGLASGYGIAKQLIQEPAEIQPKYMAFLKSGNTQDTLSELEGLNVVLEGGKALEDCYLKLEKLLDELESTL